MNKKSFFLLPLTIFSSITNANLVPYNAPMMHSGMMQPSMQYGQQPGYGQLALQPYGYQGQPYGGQQQSINPLSFNPSKMDINQYFVRVNSLNAPAELELIGASRSDIARILDYFKMPMGIYLYSNNTSEKIVPIAFHPKSQFITKLTLVDNGEDLNDDVMKALIESPYLVKLNTLIVNGRGNKGRITDKGFSQLVMAENFKNTLTELHLANHQIKDGNVAGHIIKSFPMLTKFNLTNNQIDDTGAKIIGAMMKSKPYIKVYVDNNYISHEVVEAINAQIGNRLILNVSRNEGGRKNVMMSGSSGGGGEAALGRRMSQAQAASEDDSGDTGGGEDSEGA